MLSNWSCEQGDKASLTVTEVALGAPTSAHNLSTNGTHTFTNNFLRSSWPTLLYPSLTRLRRYHILWVQIWDTWHLLWYVVYFKFSIHILYHLIPSIILCLSFFPSLVVDVRCPLLIPVVATKEAFCSNHNHATNPPCNMPQ